MALIRTNFPAFSVFNDLFDTDAVSSAVSSQNWAPAVNVIENDTNFEIDVAAPGMQKDQFNVVVENGILTISGNLEQEEEHNEKNYTRREFTTRSFTRSFTLPDNVDDDTIAASYQNGILKVNLNKKKEEKPKKKTIKVS